MGKTFRVSGESLLVVGAGIMGLSAAWELSRKGYPVSVFERSFFGSGASGVPYAALWPSAATKKGRGHQLHRQSLWEFERFIHQLSDAAEMPIEFARLGRVELFTSAERRRASVKETEVASAEWPSFSSEPAQRIADADEIRRLEPEVEATEWGGLVCQATAYVNTKDLLASLRSALLRNGGSLHEHCNVQDIWIDQGRARGIVADRPIPGSNVLVTAGAWTSLLCPELAKAAPVTPVKGQVILLRPRTPLFKRLLKRGKTYLIPTASGDVLVGSTSEPEAGFDEQPTLSAREQLVEAACEIVPALRDAMFVEQWVGLRPQTDSRSPHVGPVPNVASLFVAAGHFKIGIAMAPVVGNLTRQMLDPTAESST